MSRTIARGLFYSMAAVLFLWTGSLTYSFAAAALPGAHWLVPVFALVVFDVGCLSWLRVFIDYAQGTGQRSIALVLCLLDLAGVGLMVLAEIMTGGQTLAAAPGQLGELAIWGLAGWTVANVTGVIVFHLADPDARRKMAIQSERDQIFTESLERLAQKRTAVSGSLADSLAEGMLGQLVAELTIDQTQRQPVPTMAATAPAPAPNGTKPAPKAVSGGA